MKKQTELTNSSAVCVNCGKTKDIPLEPQVTEWVCTVCGTNNETEVTAPETKT